MQNISADELQKMLQNKKPVFLVDVREAWERDAAHLGGLHKPMAEVMSRADELPQKGKVVLYCEKGIRSAVLIQRLEQAGRTNLFNLMGGMQAWRNVDGRFASAF